MVVISGERSFGDTMSTERTCGVARGEGCRRPRWVDFPILFLFVCSFICFSLFVLPSVDLYVLEW